VIDGSYSCLNGCEDGDGAVSVVALLVFLSGTRKYRFKKRVGSPLTQFAEVFVAALRKRNMELPSDSSLLFNDYDPKKQTLPHSKQFR